MQNRPASGPDSNRCVGLSDGGLPDDRAKGRVREAEATLIPYLFLLIVICGEPATAATITNIMSNTFPLYHAALNVGDTMVWVNQQGIPATNYVASYGGEWESPILNYGDSFSFTFTNSGFYSYRTGLGRSIGKLAGAVTVHDWTNAPPAVTLTFPVDGSVLSEYWSSPFGFVQASVTNESQIAQVEFYVNWDLIGVATNAPYSVPWTNAVQGQYIIVAKAVDVQTNSWYSDPANVLVGENFSLSSPRILPTGELLFFFNVVAQRNTGVLFSENVSFTSSACMACPISPRAGALVDESIRTNLPATRFYVAKFFGPP